MNKFEEKAIKHTLTEMGVIKIKQDEKTTIKTTGFYCLYEYNSQIHAGYIYFRKEYEKIKSGDFIKNIKADLKEIANSTKQFKEEDKRFKKGKDVNYTKIYNFIGDEIGTMYEVLYGEFDYGELEEEYEDSKIQSLLNKGISPMDIYEKTRHKYNVNKEPGEKGFEVNGEIEVLK